MKYRIIPVTPFQQNCTLFWCEQTGEAAVVDPGGDVERILNAVEEEGVRLTKVLLTHGHLDHVGGTADLVARLKLPVEGPAEQDRFWIEGLAQQCAMFGFDPVAGFEPDRWLVDGDEVSVGDVKLSVIHCPGHTPGHVVFYDQESAVAQVGDVLFAGSIGRTDFPQGDHATLIRSIKERLLPLGDDVDFIPGHGPMSTLGDERRTNPFLR
ncbi:MBL fold metallo-hydrolase [Marinobacterium litorale]|jgi:glyoxylase-like metal-dependent hydrolase (beta-lactamase superfamily II)|uniref:MBL fold metallo-hydrolase n=1 Tax=Marinobacterium litorale TaxID=404770 RepID=UPI00041B5048|nr:MBL fold metallo-hydrolase [Marinobacterium litorale]